METEDGQRLYVRCQECNGHLAGWGCEPCRGEGFIPIAGSPDAEQRAAIPVEDIRWLVTPKFSATFDYDRLHAVRERIGAWLDSLAGAGA